MTEERHDLTVAQLGTTKMTQRGQIVIPEAIRKALGLDTGTHFIVRVVDGKVVLEVIK